MRLSAIIYKKTKWSGFPDCFFSVHELSFDKESSYYDYDDKLFDKKYYFFDKDSCQNEKDVLQ
ncbi:hypothetical protein GCM10011510_03520 [Streptococcus himalayensis]|uniref:Uncharacterized protein n=1 Tax=Streptococcus himalayensis TaxID=1888195 RepID=A0A917ED35_9STRE|nr:hypothetical protein GCM10011510_03520 [Streptococcus himalayensis]